MTHRGRRDTLVASDTLALEEDLPAYVEVRPYAVVGELCEPLTFLNGVAS